MITFDLSHNVAVYRLTKDVPRMLYNILGLTKGLPYCYAACYMRGVFKHPRHVQVVKSLGLASVAFLSHVACYVVSISYTMICYITNC